MIATEWRRWQQTRDQTIIIIVSVAHTRPCPGWRLSAPVTSVHAESEPGQRAGQPRWSAACMQVRTHYPELLDVTSLHDMSGMDGAGGPGKSSPPVPVRRLRGGGGPARTWGRGPMLPRCRSHGLRGFSLRVSRSALSISCQHVTNSWWVTVGLTVYFSWGLLFLTLIAILFFLACTPCQGYNMKIEKTLKLNYRTTTSPFPIKYSVMISQSFPF